jgi:hypothetical protein
LGFANGGRQSDSCLIQAYTALDQHGTLQGFGTAGNDILPSRHASIYLDNSDLDTGGLELLLALRGVLHHHYRVRTGGDGSPSHDGHGLAAIDAGRDSVESLARLDFADYIEYGGELG